MKFNLRIKIKTWILGLGLLVLAPSALLANDAEIDIDLCYQRASEQQVKSVILATDCPQLFADLKAKQLLVAIAPPITADVSLSQLKSLESIIQQKSGEGDLNFNNLSSLLNEIRAPEKIDQSYEWWTQFIHWLKSLDSGQYNTEFNWLLDLINAMMPSEAILQLFSQLMIYMLVAMSLAFIAWELYLARVFVRFGIQPKKAVTPKPLAIENNNLDLSLSEISHYTEVKQIPALLNYAITHLTEQQQLPTDASLTNQQLISYLQHHDASLQLPFTQLVQQAEPILYGGAKPGPELLQQCWQNMQLICSD